MSTFSLFSLTASGSTSRENVHQTFAFQFVYSDPNGFADLNGTYAIFNSSLNGINACYVVYIQAVNALYLRNDTDTMSLGPVTPGSTASVQNSQCVLNGSGSSILGSGNTLTMSVSLTFKAAFPGLKTIFMNAYDNGGLSSGWQSRGTWTVQ